MIVLILKAKKKRDQRRRAQPKIMPEEDLYTKPAVTDDKMINETNYAAADRSDVAINPAAIPSVEVVPQAEATSMGDEILPSPTPPDVLIPSETQPEPRAATPPRARELAGSEGSSSSLKELKQ